MKISYRLNIEGVILRAHDTRLFVRTGLFDPFSVNSLGVTTTNLPLGDVVWANCVKVKF